VNDAKTRAQAFVSFCDGAEEAGLVDYARRGRQVAEDCLEAIDQLDAERSARRSAMERVERLEEILLERGSA